MKRNIKIEKIIQTSIEEQKTEVVERKGIGHPDSIADGIAESVSKALCKEYLKRYGRILHHNTDECQVVGGLSTPKFGGGEILQPVYILIVGRAVMRVNQDRIPIRATAIKAAKDYLRKKFNHLNVTTDVIFDCKIGEGSIDLKGLYESEKRLANDTSFGVGYAPLSETEKLTLNISNFLNGSLRKKISAIGEDIKVMANRIEDKINMTIACAMVCSELNSPEEYIDTKEKLRELIYQQSKKYTDKEINIEINTGDDVKKNIFYLTVTGLSMENGDDGSVGRGNRVNGLITPNRPMSMEASAGKNPVTHVGKLYNILSFRIANEIMKLSSDIKETHVRIQSQIGKPIDMPALASVQLITRDNDIPNDLRKEIFSTVDEKLSNIYQLTAELVNGKIKVF